MRALRSQKSSPFGSNAVSETVRRVNAQALALLTRRAEINRRIQSLHRVVQGLRDLATSTLRDARDTAPERAMDPLHTEQTRRTHGPGDNSSPLEQGIVGRQSQLPVQSGLTAPGLSRACRIALMEAEGAASLDEIRSRIARRGSFTFSHSGVA